MSIYLGFPPEDASTVSPSLAARGIHLLRAPAGDVYIVGVVKKIQLGYRFYKTVIPAYMAAWVRRENISLKVPYHPITYPLDTAMPLPYPKLSISFSKPPTSAVLETLANVGYEKVQIRKTDIYYIDQYTLDEARKIKNTGAISTTLAPKGTVNLECLGPLALVNRIFSCFLKSHSYSAFQIDSADPATDVDDVAPFKIGKRKATATTGARDEEATMETADATTDTIKFREAKPTRNDYHGWGPAADMPNTSGVYLPFVPDLAASDTKTVPRLINEYFMESLGRNETEIINTHRLIVRVWGNVGMTEVGNILAHMAVAIRLAISIQCYVYAIFEGGVFEGCVICGAEFAIGLRGRVMSPVSYAQLQSAVAECGSHQATLVAIAERVGEMEEEIQSVESMRALGQILVGCSVTEEDKDHIRRDARRLNFRQKAWPVNATTLTKAMDLIRDPDITIDEDVPLHPSMLFSRDRIELVLGAFGYQAPSFNIPNTSLIKLSKGQQAPQTFAVRIVDLSIAISDLKDVITSKTIRNNPRNLSARYQDRSFGGVEKDVIYGGLLTMVGVTDVVDATTGGGEVVVAGTSTLDW